MKKYFHLFLLLFYLISYSLNINAADVCICSLDMENHAKWPKNYRSTRQINSKIARAISTTGLCNLNVSGSAQFSEQQLKQLIQVIPVYPFIDIDLRQESHGFLNGNAVSCRANNNWGNLGKTIEKIEADEALFLNNLEASKIAKVAVSDNYVREKTSCLKIAPVKSIFSEKKLVQKYGIKYKRFYIADHCRPTNWQVDQFIGFIKTLPPHAWLHFHCRAGKGRTTTFMVMYDIIHNANSVSFEAILARQAALGGTDLKKLPSPSDKFFSCALSRLIFLKYFYLYCRTNHDNFMTSWNSWILALPVN